MSYFGFARMTSMSLLIAATGLTVLAPTDAEACSPKECADSPRFLSLALGAAEISPDGVIAFNTHQGNDQLIAPDDVLEQIRVTVTDANEAAVAGALEHDGGVYFWRPEAALPAGTTLTVQVSVDNDALDAKSVCGMDTYGPLEVAIAETALPELALPELSPATAYDVRPLLQLDTVVCCDGAYPELAIGSCFEEVHWPEGFCTPNQGTGVADVTFDLSALDPLLAGSVRVELLIDGEVTSSALGSLALATWRASRDEVFEAQIQLVSLLDGSTIQSDAFMADGGDPDGLGPLELDIAATLDRNCESVAYTCELDGEFGEAWDPKACEPWDDDGGDTDGGSDSDTDGGSDSDTDGGSDSDSDGGSDSDSDGGSDSDSEGGSDSDAGSGSDTDGGSEQDGDGGGCSVGASGEGGGWLMLFGLGALPLLRRRR